MLEAVIFDLDDTLYDYKSLNEAALQELSLFLRERLNIPETQFYEAFDWARSETKKRLGNTGASHNRLLYYQKTLERLGRRPVGLALDMYEVYWGYFLEHMRLRNGADELLRSCRAKKIKIGICTDLTAHIQHRKIQRLGISDWIDAFVSSEEAGAEKPAQIMYQLILEKLEVHPGNAVFVGDDLEKDVKGPQKIGMKAIWLHSEKVGSWITASSLNEVRECLYVCG